MCRRHQLQFVECGCFVLKLTEHGDWLQQFTWTLCDQLAGGICSDWQPSEEVFLKHGCCPVHQRRLRRQNTR